MERELVVLVPGGRAQARSLRHALEEFEVLDLHHRLHVEQRLLLERLVDPRAARTLGARKGEPVAAHNAPALLKVLPGVKLVLLQGESFAVEQSEPDAALDGVLVRLHPERDELVLVEPGGELLQALRLRRQSCRGRALHVRNCTVANTAVILQRAKSRRQHGAHGQKTSRCVSGPLRIACSSSMHRPQLMRTLLEPANGTTSGTAVPLKSDVW
mmetsp:Transcript_14474/g.36670  ORF Transcript_14474/g.36670 Transcript_14474/m.36670 type:complete len:214 (+) Transcript_14474:124-765(+)